MNRFYLPCSDCKNYLFNEKIFYCPNCGSEIKKITNQIIASSSNQILKEIIVDLEELLPKKDKIDAELLKYEQIYDYLKSTISDLSEAYTHFHEACKNKFGVAASLNFGNYYAVRYDMHNSFKIGKSVLERAGKNINLAGNIDQEISQVNAIANVFSGFFSLIESIELRRSDRTKICSAIYSIKQTNQQINIICSKITNDISQFKLEITTLNEKITKLRDSEQQEMNKILEKELRNDLS